MSTLLIVESTSLTLSGSIDATVVCALINYDDYGVGLVCSCSIMPSYEQVCLTAQRPTHCDEYSHNSIMEMFNKDSTIN